METSVFMTNKTQAVRLPVNARFAEGVKKVKVRVVGNERILSPVESQWDSFFFGASSVSEDFLAIREPSHQAEREAF